MRATIRHLRIVLASGDEDSARAFGEALTNQLCRDLRAAPLAGGSILSLHIVVPPDTSATRQDARSAADGDQARDIANRVTRALSHLSHKGRLS